MDLFEAKLLLFVSKVKTELQACPVRFNLYVDSAEPEQLRHALTHDLHDGELSQVIVQKSLPAGDYWFVCNDMLVYVLERKALSDYNGCLDDPRYLDQLFRLCQLPIPRDHVTYLLEHEDEQKIQHYKGKNRILFELRKLKIQYGIDVDWTMSGMETLFYIFSTLRLLCRHWERIVEEIREFFQVEDNKESLPLVTDILNNNNNNKKEKKKKEEEKQEEKEVKVVVQEGPIRKVRPSILDDYCNFTKLSKKGNDTPENLFHNQISSIRGMGKSKAAALIARFPSYKSLVNFLDVHGTDETIQVLTSLQCQGRKRTQNFGPILAKKVIGSLLTVSSDSISVSKKIQRVRKRNIKTTTTGGHTKDKKRVKKELEDKE